MFYIGFITLMESKLGGKGVFATNDIKVGECIEKGIMTRMTNVDGNENPHLFTWSDDRKVWCCGSGLLAFYNHSDNPNIRKVADLKNDTLEIYATKDIKKGEEVCGSYYSKKWRRCFQSF
jgi:SET domain-containing protein